MRDHAAVFARCARSELVRGIGVHRVEAVPLGPEVAGVDVERVEVPAGAALAKARLVVVHVPFMAVTVAALLPLWWLGGVQGCWGWPGGCWWDRGVHRRVWQRWRADSSHEEFGVAV